MWRKTSTTTIIPLIALFTLTLTVTQSSAQKPQCQQFRAVGEVLKSYDIPGGIFPSNVQSFTCDAVSAPGVNLGLSLVIQLRNPCTLTTELFAGLTNTVQYGQQITAIVYRRLISDVSGVISGFSAPSSSPLGPINILLRVNKVRVVQPFDSKFVQFYDAAGIGSPPLPISFINSEPPLCVPIPGLRQAAFHADASTGVAARRAGSYQKELIQGQPAAKYYSELGFE